MARRVDSIISEKVSSTAKPCRPTNPSVLRGRGSKLLMKDCDENRLQHRNGPRGRYRSTSCSEPDHRIDLASRTLSLHAFGELRREAGARMTGARLVLPPNDTELDLLGSTADRTARNRLQGRWLVARCAAWIEKAVEVRRANGPVPQGAIVLRNGDGRAEQALLGSFSFSTDGLGLAPGNPLNLIQASETPEECDRLGQWFDAQWSALDANPTVKASVVELLRSLAAHRDPLSVYALILHHLFRAQGRRSRRRSGRQVGYRDSRHGGMEETLQVPARWGRRRH